MPDLSHVCNLCCSSWQHQILNPLSEAGDWTCILTEPMLVPWPAEPQQELPGVPFINAHLGFKTTRPFVCWDLIGQTGGEHLCLWIISDGPSLEKQQMMIREKTQKHLDDYAKQGLRTLCIAKKVRLLSSPTGFIPSHVWLSFNEN